MSIKVVVFDFDGTLADSNEFKEDAWSIVFKGDPRISQSLLEDVTAHNVGTRFDILRDLFVRSGVKTEEIERLVAEYAERYDAAVRGRIMERGLNRGAEETLSVLSRDRCLYINSATAHLPLAALAERLGIRRYFKDVLGMPPSKEENLRSILAREGVDSKEAVVVGDGENDYRAARACNARFIAVNSGFHDWSGYGGDFPIISGIHQANDAIRNLSS